MTLAAEPWDFAGVMTVVNRPQNKRLFKITLALSVALHLAAIAVVPRVSKPEDIAPRPLEVVIVQPPVPKPVRPETPPPPPERVVAKPQPQVQRTPTVAPQPTPQPKPVIALPESAAPSQPTFTVAQPTVPTPTPPAEPKAAAAPPSPPAAAREAVAATPPDFNAAYLRNAPPRYPLIARRNGVEGTVRLKVFVSRDGRAGQVQLDRSSGSSALDSAAIEAVKNWQFAPARRGDEIIESWVIVPLVFKLEGAS
jgi:protein TonB